MIKFLKFVHYKMFHAFIVVACITSLNAQNTALDFDGTNDYVQITDDASLTSTSAITICAWFKKNVRLWLDEPLLVKGLPMQMRNTLNGKG